MSDKHMQVAAIENGTVIDHIPSDRVMQVVNLLGLERATSAVTIGYNLPSHVMGSKAIIKVADRYFSEEQIAQLAVVAGGLTLCVIRDYEIAVKRKITLPAEILGIVRCCNPKCITNNEPMRTRHYVRGAELLCHYCNGSQPIDKAYII